MTLCILSLVGNGQMVAAQSLAQQQVAYAQNEKILLSEFQAGKVYSVLIGSGSSTWLKISDSSGVELERISIPNGTIARNGQSYVQLAATPSGTVYIRSLYELVRVGEPTIWHGRIVESFNLASAWANDYFYNVADMALDGNGALFLFGQETTGRGNGLVDLIVIRFDTSSPTLVPMWKRYYSVADEVEDYAASIKIRRDGTLQLLGHTNLYNGTPRVPLNQEVYSIRLATDGRVLDLRILPLPNNQAARAGGIDADGNLIFLVRDWFESPVFPNPSIEQARVVKFSPSGALLWSYVDPSAWLPRGATAVGDRYYTAEALQRKLEEDVVFLSTITLTTGGTKERVTRLSGNDGSRFFQVDLNADQRPKIAQGPMHTLVVGYVDISPMVRNLGVTRLMNRYGVILSEVHTGSNFDPAPVPSPAFVGIIGGKVRSGFNSARSRNVNTIDSHIASYAMPLCAADITMDGGVDGDDVSAFYSSFERSSASSDLNLSSSKDRGDESVFFTAWEQGGC